MRADATSVVLATAVGAATGSRAAAAALACAGSESDRAALLVDLGSADRRPRSTLVATTGARALEERLVAHMPDARVASRGRLCELALPADPAGVARIAEALPLARESLAVIYLPPGLLHAALDDARVRPSAALLRADLVEDRALAALVAGDLIAGGVRVAVLKCPLGWLAARAALLGALPHTGQALPNRLRDRLLDTADNAFHRCYDRRDGLESDGQEASEAEPQGSGVRAGTPQGAQR